VDRIGEKNTDFRPVNRYNSETIEQRHIRYLGVCLVSSKSLKCSLSNSKRSFYRSFNAIFGKVGRLAAEPVMLNC